MEIKGSKIIITGGSSGTGKATAKLLKEKGADVLITGRSAERLLLAAAETGCSWIEADVSKTEDVEKTFQWIKDNWNNRLDVLINNAGIGEFASVEESPRELSAGDGSEFLWPGDDGKKGASPHAAPWFRQHREPCIYFFTERICQWFSLHCIQVCSERIYPKPHGRSPKSEHPGISGKSLGGKYSLRKSRAGRAPRNRLQTRSGAISANHCGHSGVT